MPNPMDEGRQQHAFPGVVTPDIKVARGTTDKLGPKTGLITPAQVDKLALLPAGPTGTATDLNSIVNTGWYMVAATASNTPSTTASANYYVQHVQAVGADYAYQTAYPVNSASVLTWRYTRAKESGVWGAWRIMDYDSGWVDMSPYYTNSFGNWSTGWEVKARRLGSVVYWRGMVSHGAAAATGPINALINIPAQFAAPYSVMYSGAAGDGFRKVNVSGNAVGVYDGIAASNWVSLGGLVYTVD